MKKAIAAGAVAGLALAGAGAGVANAAYPPQPAGGSASASTAGVGTPITFTCGTTNPFLAGSTVNWVTQPSGPSTTSTADSSGIATVTFSFSTPGSYAYLRISHGCDHTCSFCAIPAIRGPHRSKRPGERNAWGSPSG